MSNYINQTYSGRYKILEELPNQNDYEFYFKGKDLQTNKDLQFRIIPIYKDNPSLTEQSQKFIFKELNLMKKLKFKGLPVFVDSISNENENVIITEYQNGKSLEEFLKRTPQLSEKDTLQLLSKLLPIIRYLHSQEPPVIYRDLQPKNIFINVNGDVYLAKYEAARTYKADKVKDTVVVSTRGYNPPEQALGKGQSDPRSDIYSIGMVVFQMLTGIDPTASLILPKVSDKRKDISPIWTQLVSKATNIKQDKRYVSVDELLADLQRIQSGSLAYNPAENKMANTPAQPQTPKPGLSVKTATGQQPSRPAVITTPRQPVQIQSPQARPNIQTQPAGRPPVQSYSQARPNIQTQPAGSPPIQTAPTVNAIQSQPSQPEPPKQEVNTEINNQVTDTDTNSIEESTKENVKKPNVTLRLIAIALVLIGIALFFVLPQRMSILVKGGSAGVCAILGIILFIIGKPKNV